jgi:outer membrane murein-binding lipoprotein Lpp
MNKQNSPQLNEPIQSSKNIWIIVISVIITVLIVSGVVYAWQKSNLKSIEQKLQQQIISLENQIEQLQEKIGSQDMNNKTNQTPSDALSICKKINQPCQSYSQGVGGGDSCCEGYKCDGSGPDGTTGICKIEGCEGQSCRSFSQGVGGGDSCCEGYKCDGSGPDGTTGICKIEGCEGQSCVGGGDSCCEGYKCDGSGPDGTTGKCIKLK